MLLANCPPTVFGILGIVHFRNTCFDVNPVYWVVMASICMACSYSLWSWTTSYTTKLTHNFLHRPPTRCVDISESPSSNPRPNPSPINQIGDGASLAVLATAVAVPLGLTLLIVTVALVVVLLYIGMVKRGRSSKTGDDIERSDGATVTENTNVNGEAEPYG